MRARAHALIRPSSPPEVSVVKEGWIVRDGARVMDAGSSVTIVQSGDARILIDTGSRSEEEALLSGLGSIGIRPDDITHVINTPMHMDHCGCNELFANALFHAHPAEGPPVGTIAISSERMLIPGLKTVPTPGHTRGSVSVFVESDRRYAICGDAIPTKANYDTHAPPAIHVDRELALRSMDAILGWASVVIPGHDRPFELLGKK